MLSLNVLCFDQEMFVRGGVKEKMTYLRQSTVGVMLTKYHCKTDDNLIVLNIFQA